MLKDNLIKKAWRFIWSDDSLLSWLLNTALAFILIKFVVYPGLGLMLSTSHPIVAVVSGSMEHADPFEVWWDEHYGWYEKMNISKEEFRDFHFYGGFNKGDIMILKGRPPESINIGDIIVFRSGRPDPIIHRVVAKWYDGNRYHFQTKGDNNMDSIKTVFLDETDISEDEIIGNAIIKVPILGYVKIWFVEIINMVKGG